MITSGLAIEAIAAVMVVAGLLLGLSGVTLLWASVVVVLAGLVVTMIGVRRARPPRRGWTPPRPIGPVAERGRS